MTQPRCERCTRPVGDGAYVCAPCAEPTAAGLATVASLVEELLTVRYRQTRYGTGGLGGWQEPWDDRAREVEAAVTNALTTVARDVAETRGLTTPSPLGPVQGPPCTWVPDGCGGVPSGRERRHGSCETIRRRAPEHPASAAARWLVGQIGWLRHKRDATAVLDELSRSVRELRRVVDRPAQRWYAGPCSARDENGEYCGTDIYAPSGATVVRCPDKLCGASYDAATRRAELLDQAADRLAHAEFIARALVALGRDITAATVRGYARHGRIVNHGWDVAGRPLYRVGDVRDTLDQAEAREAARLAKRARKDSAA